MKSLGINENIVSTLGFSSELEPYYIILEYMEQGNLQTYLRMIRGTEGASKAYDNFKLTNTDLLKYSQQIARGMEHISSKCIHRDLATRNILVNNVGICKIAGFGLASEVVDERQYRSKIQDRLTIGWLAPETIDGTGFTTKSDVWSFGILLWEIVTMGNKPYKDMCTSELKSSLKEGYRMPKPLHCDEDLYAVMLSCWSADPNARPGFRN
ncbi:fibroblast growth factor receptor 3-like [Ptychodera flava]|uniref:fibroblast growth factor receptor 3-like n=1 Tax=Ptychodera flava TaxID=63121 RepID=UPI00396A5AA2